MNPTELSAEGLDAVIIEKTVQVLSEWLRNNSGNIVAQFGITVQQLEELISNYQVAYTTGVAQVLLLGAVVMAVGAILAWFTFDDNTRD